MDENDTLNPHAAKWAIEVGRYVIAFGSIETFTHAMLRDYVGEPIANALGPSITLKPRLDLLLAVVKSREGDDWRRVQDVLEKISGAVGKRNLIAHNGVTFEVFIDAEGTMTFEEVIRSAKAGRSPVRRTPPDKRIPFEELVQHRREAEALDKELFAAAEIVWRAHFQ